MNREQQREKSRLWYQQNRLRVKMRRLVRITTMSEDVKLDLTRKRREYMREYMRKRHAKKKKLRIQRREYNQKHKDDTRVCGLRWYLKHHPYIFDACVDCGQMMLFTNPNQVCCDGCRPSHQHLNYVRYQIRREYARLCQTQPDEAQRIHDEMAVTEGDAFREALIDGLCKKIVNRKRDDYDE